ncbi:PQQ-dependent sugar dehydrogenase [Oceanibacterium hippocampi]|uniref:PQQ-dependent sugar dehydrogenase n=1 Tax=Oceanibacterium hippocampi TaxID=745714 RepID=UPI00111BD921|nr:PQQ-dependent sugar dehydrogenase [Oceanibacterium hippocampi]
MRIGRIAAIAVAIGFAALAGFVGAYVIALYDAPLLTLADNAGKTVAQGWHRMFVATLPTDPTTSHVSGAAAGFGRDERIAGERSYETIFTPLAGRVVTIPRPDRPGAGGALAAWGADILAMTHEGRFYAVDPTLDVAALDIAAPPNGYAAFAAAVTGPAVRLPPRTLGYFRYNDLLAVGPPGARALFVSFTRYDASAACYTTTIARLAVPDDDIRAVRAGPGDWTEVFSTRPCLPLKSTWRPIEGHLAGGRMVHAEPGPGAGTLYLASGDYGWDGSYGPLTIPGADPAGRPPVAQDPDADYGKVIAIDLATGRGRQISRGHRNMQGIALDRAGRVWTVEHGMRAGDELNLEVEGGNYGWPTESYSTLYSAQPLPTALSPGRHDRHRRPMLAWLPAIAPSGLARIEGFHPAWDGDLLVASLRAESLFRIRVAEDRVIFAEEIRIGEHIRHVLQHPDGRLLLWTDHQQVIVITPTAGGTGMAYVEARLERLAAEGGPAAALRQAIEGCVECHSLTPGDDRDAPSLARIAGARAGSGGYADYSPALAGDGRRWTREALTRYIADPAGTIPGTRMPAPEIADPAVIEALVDILEGLASDLEMPAASRPARIGARASAIAPDRP